MIYAQPNTTFEATMTGAPTGLVGTLTVQLVDPPTGRTIIAATTAGIVEFPAGSGIYTVTLTAPSEEGTFVVAWSNRAAEELYVSGRVVAGALPTLPTVAYALPGDVRAFTTHARVLALDDATLTKYITASEPDVDRATGFGGTAVDGPRRFDPTTLTQADRSTLARATAAQVEFRVLMGDDFFIRPQYAKVSGPEFSYEGALPRIGQRVFDELAGSGILRLSTSWRGEGAAPAWASFAYNIDN